MFIIVNIKFTFLSIENSSSTVYLKSSLSSKTLGLGVKGDRSDGVCWLLEVHEVCGCQVNVM